MLVLGPSLGTSTAVWDAQVPALAQVFRVVRWDLPGHGRSPAGPFGAGGTVAQLARLVLGIADALGVDRFHYAGISLGGAVGTWLAAHRPDRIDALALVCTSARFGPPARWRERAALVRAKGTAPLADTAAERWFTPEFAAGGAPAVRTLTAALRAADPAAYAACCDALAALDLRPDLHRITAPTLVVAGRHDVATPPAHARALADGIAEAALVELPRTGHLAPVERPEAVLAALLAHFEPAVHGPGSRYGAG
ncbi:3-oxoadipate enol-lactonase [Streptomyces sp. 184]|uniref:3-oxoadipate enol-lactonase n=1 Tax=Streptomyces sp. 184 TaxID=1827526 RepID=UPI0038912133